MHNLPSYPASHRSGALRFDKDLRSVSGYLNALLPFGTTRDRFTKLTQIALIVNMESAAEIAEYYGTGGAATASTALSPSSAIQWRLSVAEIRKVLALRFGVAEASAVKF